MRDSELNPDYVRFQNDKKKKKETKRHLQQKLEWERKRLKQDEAWLKRSQERVDEQRTKINQMEIELDSMD